MSLLMWLTSSDTNPVGRPAQMFLSNEALSRAWGRLVRRARAELVAATALALERAQRLGGQRRTGVIGDLVHLRLLQLQQPGDRDRRRLDLPDQLLGGGDVVLDQLRARERIDRRHARQRRHRLLPSHAPMVVRATVLPGGWRAGALHAQVERRD